MAGTAPDAGGRRVAEVPDQVVAGGDREPPERPAGTRAPGLRNGRRVDRPDFRAGAIRTAVSRGG